MCTAPGFDLIESEVKAPENFVFQTMDLIIVKVIDACPATNNAIAAVYIDHAARTIDARELDISSLIILLASFILDSLLIYGIFLLITPDLAMPIRREPILVFWPSDSPLSASGNADEEEHVSDVPSTVALKETSGSHAGPASPADASPPADDCPSTKDCPSTNDLPAPDATVPGENAADAAKKTDDTETTDVGATTLVDALTTDDAAPDAHSDAVVNVKDSPSADDADADISHIPDTLNTDTLSSPLGTIPDATPSSFTPPTPSAPSASATLRSAFIDLVIIATIP
ncbi:hypothetical protein BD626DRAFT_637044, partial [Schizophyllum amplum]